MPKKVTREMVEDFEVRWAKGELAQDIAASYGLHRTCVSMHLDRFKRKIKWETKWSNEYVTDGDITTVLLMREGQHKGTMVIDTTDEPTTRKHKWRVSSWGYAVTSLAEAPWEWHRLFNPAPDGLVNDHINRNKLDNRRSNLRHVSCWKNVRNSERCDKVDARPVPVRNTRFRWTGSVSYNKNSGKWEAQLPRVKGAGSTYLGTFAEKHEAEAALRKAINEEIVPERRTYRKRGTGSIQWMKKDRSWQARLRGEYVGQFQSREEAEAALDKKVRAEKECTPKTSDI